MRVGIIGCGAVALKAHIPTFTSLGLNIIGVADKNPKVLCKVPPKKRYPNYKDLLDENLDLVSICTPLICIIKCVLTQLKAGSIF